MPMDGLMLCAVAWDLQTVLIGSRVDKVNQPEDDELILHLRGEGESHKLLLCANPSFARIHLTEEAKQNPPSAPMFCMLLRKHLTGARVTDVKQISNERVMYLSLDGRNDFGEPQQFRLYAEIMGKHSNLILVGTDGRIIDCIRRVTAAMSRVRQLLPGLEYVLPPSQDKCDPFTFHGEFPLQSSARFLCDRFMGISPASAEEIAFRSQTDGIDNAFPDFLRHFRQHDLAPCILLDDAKTPVDFFAFPYRMFLLERQLACESISTAIERCNLLRDRARRIQEQAKELKQKLKQAQERCEKNRDRQQEKLRECADMEKYRIFGELLTASLYAVPRGVGSVRLPNYYSETQEELEIPLDVRLSPAANAQKYFKQYAKLKTASRLLTTQREENDRELEDIVSQLENLEHCETKEDLADIRAELEKAGLIKKRTGIKVRQTESRPMHFVSSAGTDIFVGKNNTQNDRLTLSASPDDTWLHVKGAHGCHVVVKASTPDEKTLEDAAILAAWFSGARTSAQVPVDCTKRRFVKKPSGSPPGKVVYTNYVTYFLTSTEDAVKAIRRLET